MSAAEESSEGAGEEVALGPQASELLHLPPLLSERKRAAKRLAHAVLLPSGIEARKFSLRAEDGGKHLELAVE